MRHHNSKKERSDKGTVRINGRDLRCLHWLLDMGAAYEDDLTLVLSPDQRLSSGAAKAVVRRWQVAGLARADALLADRGRIVRLTENAARLLGDVARWEDRSVMAAVHTAEVARTRLLLERWTSLAQIPVVSWTTPYQWRLENERAVAAGFHVPDGVVRHTDGSIAAVQVERINRGVAYARSVAVDLLRRFPRTIYAFPEEGEEIRQVVMSGAREAAELIRRGGGTAGEAIFVPIPVRLVFDHALGA